MKNNDEIQKKSDTDHENDTGLSPLILAIDDDESIRILMATALERYGFRVAVAENGRHALDMFTQLNPDAILTDVSMPEMNGYEVCTRIRRMDQGRYTPILVMTGMDDVESIDMAFRVGATDFMSKPINWTILNYRVKYMLRASAAFHDVIHQQKTIQELAYFDHLTGLANRIMFKKALDREVKKMSEQKGIMAVLFLDLDRFKIVNDSLGHQAGDELLQQVAERIKASIRSTDCLGQSTQLMEKASISRQGGDEFSIMLPCLHSPTDAGQVAKRINEKLGDSFFVNNQEVFISSSIGISLFPIDGNDGDSLLKYADLAMYNAKGRGGDRFSFYEKGLNIQARQRLEFENDVRKAVARDELSLYYQPQVSLSDGRIVGAEALSRWNSERLGQVSPAEFIPAIEELGLIIPFTDWVIEEAGRQQLQWYESGIDPVRVAVNISSVHFIEQDIPDKIIKMLHSNNLPCTCLEVELTESVMADSGRETLAILNRLKEIGLSISVDDFGTGFSSLTYLKNFPVDVVKIDQFFVKDILSGKKEASIVKAIISMAHSMGMKVVAEGIETREQMELLFRMKCDYGQGYLFSPAVSEEEFTAILTEGTRFEIPAC